jgi:glycosyltransferase involved in cell wall biosynthesis
MSSPTAPAGRGPRLTVHVLMADASGGGGVARTVVNLANHLAQHHDVELISVFQSRREPRFELDPRVRRTVLHHVRPPHGWVGRLLGRFGTRLRPLPVDQGANLFTDLLLRRKLRRLRGDVLVTTRPWLHLAAVTWAPPGIVTIGQDHLNFRRRMHNERQAALMRAVIPRLDALAVLTRADARDYRQLAEDSRVRIVKMPNALPWPVADEPAPLEDKVVISAGRLVPQKGFDRLVEAWAQVAPRHPDWQVHIYGTGDGRRNLLRQARELGVEGQVQLKGYTTDLRTVLRTASVYALTSRFEGFGMVLIEAMSQGVPPVAMNCPRGPGEIVHDGENGLLVRNRDVDGFAEALETLISDTELRRRLGRQAHQDARDYEREPIGRRWETLFTELLAARRG